ncbi:BA14K family protein [Bartonella sp. B30(2025)]
MFRMERIYYVLVILFIGIFSAIIANITGFAKKSRAKVQDSHQSFIQDKWVPVIVTGRRELNGFKGYRHYRSGYRKYSDNWWYPEQAFVTFPLLNTKHVPLKTVSAFTKESSLPALEKEKPWMLKQHIDSCMERYRSYNKNDNSYQPFHGPRKQCFSRIFKG